MKPTGVTRSAFLFASFKEHSPVQWPRTVVLLCTYSEYWNQNWIRDLVRIIIYFVAALL
jgi:hypothetical protein